MFVHKLFHVSRYKDKEVVVEVTLQWFPYQDFTQVLPANVQPPHRPQRIGEDSVLRLQEELSYRKNISQTAECY